MEQSEMVKSEAAEATGGGVGGGGGEATPSTSVLSNGTAAATQTLSAPQTSSLQVSIDGKPALMRYDEEYLFVHRGVAEDKNVDPSTAYLCVPLALVLHASFVPDSDGGSLLIRLLTPPLKGRSALAASLAPAPIAGLQKRPSRSRKSSANGQTVSETPAKLGRREKLRAQLEGPCASLRLLKIEARVTLSPIASLAPAWATKLMSLAYTSWGVTPHRRLKVIINPIGGPGKAGPLFETRVRPILEAAGCRLDVQYTKHKDHGVSIARELDIQKYDALVCVSGDGMLHEVLNGLAQRPDAKTALDNLPVVPVPAGSGNAMSVNLFGPQQGLSLALASLNAIKGRPLRLDVCNVTQSKPETEGGGYAQYYSFVSQAIGLMADLDLGTEDLRALGDARFILGFVTGVLRNRTCDIELDLLFGEEGGVDKQAMRKRALERDAEAEEAGDRQGVEELLGGGDIAGTEQGLPPLQHGSVLDPLTDLPDAPTDDPSFPHGSGSTTAPVSPSGWYRFPLPLSSLYGGKIPYVSRDLLQFPFSRPSDSHIDLCLMLHSSGRLGKLRAIGNAESGAVVYDRGAIYAKVKAFRVSPKQEEGDRRLRKGGLIAIDGEKVPFRPFQVEVARGLGLNVLSLYGRLCTPDVPPPQQTAKRADA